MKTLKLSLLALSVISIAACSGGGGSSKAPVIVIPSETAAKKEDVKPKKTKMLYLPLLYLKQKVIKLLMYLIRIQYSQHQA